MREDIVMESIRTACITKPYMENRALHGDGYVLRYQIDHFSFRLAKKAFSVR